MARRRRRNRNKNKRSKVAPGMRAYDFNLPVLAYRRTPAGGIETPEAVIYGTAFPIAEGLFATAAHVVEAAAAKGNVGLSYVTGAGEPILHHDVVQYDLAKEIDLAVLYCPSLKHLSPMPLDFDQPLDLLHPVMSMGFPMALDVEYVTCVPRAFMGHVVTRRQLYHLPGQPPGYEVSFFAPLGLSGAPLMSNVYGAPRCYGYVIQQSTIGLGAEHERTPVGIAVTIDVLLRVESSFSKDGRLASVLGHAPVPPRPPKEKQLPGGQRRISTEELEKGWPDDLPDI